MTTSRSLRLVVALAACLLVLATCGDDASSGSDDGSSVFDDSSGSDSDDQREDDGTFGSSSGDATALDLFTTEQCRDALQGYLSVLTAYGTAFGGGTAGDDYQRFVGLLEDYSDVAPSEIRDSFEIIAREIGVFFERLAELGFQPGQQPDPSTIEAIQAISDDIDQDAVDEASEDISNWFETNCTTG